MNATSKSDLFRLLPSVKELMNSAEIQAIVQQHGYRLTVQHVRLALDELRDVINKGELREHQIRADLSRLPKDILFFFQRWFSYSLRPVINATGVILHTNLGRASLSQAALEHVAEVSAGYSNLEFDLSTGERGKRDVHVDRLFAKLLNTGRS